MQERTKNILIVVLLALVSIGSFSLGTHWGYNDRVRAETISSLFGEDTYDIPDVDFTLLLRAWHLIDEKYAFPDAPSEEDKLWGAISGLVKSIGDPYSAFLPPEQAKIFTEDIQGNFGGVGIEIGIRDDILTVVAPLRDTPGDMAGIHSGDRIIKIDNIPTGNITIEEAVLLIRGERGTDVVLTIFRENGNLRSGGETIDFKITRATIDIPTIETEVIDGVYVIRLFNFSAQSTGKFSAALSDFNESDTNKLILDFRGNPGGFLDASIEIASLFLPTGKIIVIENFGNDAEETMYRSTGGGNIPDGTSIVILVDQGSASASEIVAAALQEHGVATLVGDKTFGKGSVQELVPLTPNTFLKITVAKWFTPNGISISEEGIEPDVYVEAGDDQEDAQLNAALDILNNNKI